jgi:hypothetical protein
VGLCHHQSIVITNMIISFNSMIVTLTIIFIINIIILIIIVIIIITIIIPIIIFIIITITFFTLQAMVSYLNSVLISSPRSFIASRKHQFRQVLKMEDYPTGSSTTYYLKQMFLHSMIFMNIKNYYNHKTY